MTNPCTCKAQNKGAAVTNERDGVRTAAFWSPCHRYLSLA
jgi:hypothetical protein